MSAAASWWHCGTNPGSRSKGQSAVASIAYRFAEKLHDERYDLTHDYTRKRGVLDKFIVAPEDAPQWAYDPERLWNAAERAEKKSNSTIFRDTVLALPAYLSPQERRDITHEFAQEISDRYGVAVSVALHAPGKQGDQRNYHAHLMFTTRELTADGFGKKTRILDDKKTGPKEITWIQQKGQDIMNRYLEAAGSDERVDRRSFKDRGIEREPTSHLGPNVSEMERRGVKTDRGNVNRDVEQRNAEREALKAELASIGSVIGSEEARLSSPATSPEDSHKRLQADRQLFAEGLTAAARLEKDLPPDRMGWSERTLLFVARTARSILKGMAEKARGLIASRNLNPDRRKRQQPTAKDRRWQSQEQIRRQAEKNRGIDL